MRPRTRSLAALLPLALACGPPGVAPEQPGDATGSSTSETGEPGETETESSGESGFVPENDHSPLSECSTFAQDCPEGEKCVPYASSGGSWDAAKCVPVLGDQGVGEPCTYAGAVEATDDCAANSMCWDVMEVDGELLGTCTPFCSATANDPECPEGYSCSTCADCPFAICIPNCDPLVQDCEFGHACYWEYRSFKCIFTIQNIPIGEPCGFINDCAAGLICVDGQVLPACEGPACCTAFCDIGQADPCEAQLPGTACVPFFEQDMAPPGYEQVGVCVVPQP